jgi:rSAM/selenodomain-associated transferase 1
LQQVAPCGEDEGVAQQENDTLVLFARNPEPGAVKTRLAATLGAAEAAALYRAFLRDLALRFRGGRITVRWSIAPPVGGFAGELGLDGRDCFAQEGEDLGARMHAAFRRVLARPGARCVLIGSDMPQLSVELVGEAFAELDRVDLVLGPAEDGGYYLIAMREPHDVFSGITWSQPSVLAETLTRASALDLRVHLLASGFDIDELRDLERLRELLAEPAARAAMPWTSAVLGLAPPP